MIAWQEEEWSPRLCSEGKSRKLRGEERGAQGAEERSAKRKGASVAKGPGNKKRPAAPVSPMKAKSHQARRRKREGRARRPSRQGPVAGSLTKVFGQKWPISSKEIFHAEAHCRIANQFRSICFAVCGAISILLSGSARVRRAVATKPSFYDGKIVPIKELVEKIGSKLDADAEPTWLALETDKGDIYPLIKDEGSRMFFKDATLLKRPMSLTGKLLPNSTLIQVLEVNSMKDGKLHDIYYWCDICSIKRYEKKICECCGGPMELREEPVRDR